MSTLDKFLDAAPQTYRVLSGAEAEELALHMQIEDNMAFGAQGAGANATL
jgi:hypothetical protein